MALAVLVVALAVLAQREAALAVLVVEAEVLVELLSRQSFSAVMARTTP